MNSAQVRAGPTDAQVEKTLQLLRKAKDVTIAPGLSSEEFANLEAKYGFRFPPDVKQFLRVGVPLNKSGSRATQIPSELPAFYQTASDGWHNWHLLALDDIQVGCEADTVTKQIRWHATPEADKPQVPPDCGLIPLYCHRMIPSNPCQAGNPVFSMHGCYDNIIYGSNLWTYLEHDHEIVIPEEFNKGPSTPLDDIPYWGDGMICGPKKFLPIPVEYFPREKK